MNIHELAGNVARFLAQSSELQYLFYSKTGTTAQVHFPAIGSETFQIPDGPLVVVSPAHESAEDGERSRDVLLSVSLRVDGDGADASKPAMRDGVHILERGAALAELSEAVLAVLKDAPVGSRLTGWDSDFDFDAYPRLALETTLHYSDNFAF